MSTPAFDVALFGEAMLLLDEICYNRLCHPVMRSLSYYTNFFDFSILRKLL